MLVSSGYEDLLFIRGSSDQLLCADIFDPSANQYVEKELNMQSLNILQLSISIAEGGSMSESVGLCDYLLQEHKQHHPITKAET